MSADGWITLVVLVAAVALMASERVQPAVAMVGAVIVLVTLDVLKLEDAFLGFANDALVTIAALYVIAHAAETTGLTTVLSPLFGRPRGERANLVRILGITATASAFVPNTPLVQAMAPQVADWTRRNRLSASRYLMPMSYAALLGGMVTLIGTSTNLTVAGLMQKAKMAPMGLFEITKVGLPVAVVGVVVLVLVLPVVLPKRKGTLEQLGEGREFTVEMVVPPGSPLAGQTVEEAGLRHLEGVFLFEIERGRRVIAPARPDEALEEDDRLIFAGNVAQILDLQRIRGLVSAEQRHFDLGRGGLEQRFYEAVVGANSGLAGTTLKRAGFRSQYGAAVLAIHRAGQRLPAKLGEVVLRPGDVLIVLGEEDFASRWGDRGDFLVIAPVGGTNPIRTSRAPVVGTIVLAMVVLATTGAMPLAKGALLAALLVVVLRILSPREARFALDLDVLVLIGASVGLSTAIQQSGLAAELARLLTDASAGLGPTAALAGVLVATTILTGLISNNAAAALMFPIGVALARGFGADARPFVFAIALAASIDFMTPVGYQTNALIYSMGGYRFLDFTRVGAPVTVVSLALATVLIPVAWPF